MKKQTVLNLIRFLSLAIVALTAITISVKFAASAQDKIQYNAVYECGSGKSKFRVLSCKGTDKFDRCDVFYINELSPGGGHKVSTYRSGIEDDIKQGCKTKNSPAVKNETNEDEQTENVTPVSNTTGSQNKSTTKENTDSAVACFASDSESDVKNANEKNFRGVLRSFWEKKAEKNSDGTVTLTFQKMTIGAPRRWRPTFDDAYSQADPRKPIYPVRATFTICTDYKTAISKRKMERIYDCFVHKTGGWQCTQTGASGALALKDEKEYIQKQQ